MSEECTPCNQWTTNFQLGLHVCENIGEKIRLLTLLPETFSKNSILKSFFGVAMYMLDEARKLKFRKGVHHFPDPYCGHPLNDEAIRVAIEYYLNDDLDCSRQSPNKNDVVNVYENNEKVKKVKPFLTRSINEIYHVFQEKNPTIHIHMKSKFSSLRPK